MGERFHGMEEVRGSNPLTSIKALAAADGAPMASSSGRSARILTPFTGGHMIDFTALKTAS